MRRIFFFSALCLALLPACTGPTRLGAAGQFEITFGILNHPEIRPLKIDQLTNTIPLKPDGSLPMFAARVEAKGPDKFVLAYVVYRRDSGKDTYQLTEKSVRWLIGAQGKEPIAFITPSFADGVLVGDYRFEVYVDGKLATTVAFSVTSAVT